MGWISYHVNTYTKNGKQVFDRKKECDAELTRGMEKDSKILKSAMVGSTYYAAVQSMKPDGSAERVLPCASTGISGILRAAKPYRRKIRYIIGAT